MHSFFLGWCRALAKSKIPFDCVKNSCTYTLPHYHCRIPGCGKSINIGDGDRRTQFHPCCSEDHIKLYNKIFYCSECGSELMETGANCSNSKCKDAKSSAVESEAPKVASRPVTNLDEYRRAKEGRSTSN